MGPQTLARPRPAPISPAHPPQVRAHLTPRPPGNAAAERETPGAWRGGDGRTRRGSGSLCLSGAEWRDMQDSILGGTGCGGRGGRRLASAEEPCPVRSLARRVRVSLLRARDSLRTGPDLDTQPLSRDGRSASNGWRTDPLAWQRGSWWIPWSGTGEKEPFF